MLRGMLEDLKPADASQCCDNHYCMLFKRCVNAVPVLCATKNWSANMSKQEKDVPLTTSLFPPSGASRPRA